MATNNKNTTYAFIDSQNLNLGVKSQRWKLDFGRFRKYLKDKYQVNKAFLFIGHVADNEKLYTYLQQSGYHLIYKPTLEKQEDEKTIIKGNVDAELVLHSMIEFQNYHKAIIVSGDGDFRCLVEYLHQQNKLLKLIVPSQKYSSLLREFSQYIVNINLFRSKVEYKAQKKTGIRGRSKP